MKKAVIKNMAIFLSLLLLSVPYNYCVNYYAKLISIMQYVPVIIFAFLCGATLTFMDLSNKKANFVFALLFLLVAMIELGGFGDIFLHSPTAYFYIVIFGVLLTSTFKKPYM